MTAFWRLCGGSGPEVGAQNPGMVCKDWDVALDVGAKAGSGVDLSGSGASALVSRHWTRRGPRVSP